MFTRHTRVRVPDLWPCEPNSPCNSSLRRWRQIPRASWQWRLAIWVSPGFHLKTLPQRVSCMVIKEDSVSIVMCTHINTHTGEAVCTGTHHIQMHTEGRKPTKRDPKKKRFKAHIPWLTIRTRTAIIQIRKPSSSTHSPKL